MALYLIDTNVVSEAGSPRPDPGVVAFLRRESDLCVSVILFEELSFGLDRAPPERRARLTLFVEGVFAQFGARALPVDLDIARLSGRLRANANNAGRMLHMADALMAATAITHGAILATRNERDFSGLGVELCNPFSG
ncbi:MAG: type II toxin-antitoxin system VapC family toxin [Methylocystis sp.]